MFVYEKKLQYPVKIKNTNPKLAAVIISQYGGPDGELGASLRYLSQRYSMPYPELKALLTDIGTAGSQSDTEVGNPCLSSLFSGTFSGDTSASNWDTPVFCRKSWSRSRTNTQFCGSRLSLNSIRPPR